MPKKRYIVLQNGGSSAEWYVSEWPSVEQAVEFRRSCWNGSMLVTTPVFEISRDLQMDELCWLLQEVIAETAAVLFPSDWDRVIRYDDI